MEMKQHLTIAAALFISFGILGVFFALIILIAIVGGGIISGDNEAIRITSIVGPIIAGFIALFAIPKIIGGIGLLKRRNWARILVLILSCISLLNIPFGTAMGIYSIWVLVHDDTVKLFESGEAVKQV